MSKMVMLVQWKVFVNCSKKFLPQVQPEFLAINGKVVMHDVRLMLFRMMKVPPCARMPMRMCMVDGMRDQLAVPRHLHWVHYLHFRRVQVSMGVDTCRWKQASIKPNTKGPFCNGIINFLWNQGSLTILRRLRYLFGWDRSIGLVIS